jgi:hypothetical protein
MPINDAVAGPEPVVATNADEHRALQVIEVCNGYTKAILENDEIMIAVYAELYDNLDKEKKA